MQLQFCLLGPQKAKSTLFIEFAIVLVQLGVVASMNLESIDELV